MIGNSIGCRIGYLNQRDRRIKRTPVDNGPVPLNAEAGIRNNRRTLVFAAYRQQFTVFTIKDGLTVTTGSTTGCDNHVVGKTNEIILLIGNINTLRTTAAHTGRVIDHESSRDAPAQADSIKLTVIQ